MKKVILFVMVLALALPLFGCGASEPVNDVTTPEPEDFSKVNTLLAEGLWFCNGGSDIKLKQLSFTEDEASIRTYTYSGNGSQTSTTTTAYTVDATSITIGELTIPYTLDGDTVILGNGDYFTVEQVEDGLQGYWTCKDTTYVLGMTIRSEDNVYINGNEFTHENATVNSDNTGYNYFGPYVGTFSITEDGLSTDIHNGFAFGFNIIDNQVVLVQYDDVFSPSTSLPGPDGYSF